MKKEMSGKDINKLKLINGMTGKKFKDLVTAEKYIEKNNLEDIKGWLNSIEFSDDANEYSYTDEEEDEMLDSKLYDDHNYTLRSTELCNANLGQRLRYFRQIAGLTQKELAEKCELSESTVRNYELGNRFPDYDTIHILSAVLEVDSLVLSRTYNASMPHAVLKYLFDLEKYYLMVPVEIDGRMYLKFDTKKAEDLLESPSSMMEQLLRVWAKFHQMFEAGEIDEETYLLWQMKYPTYATGRADDIFGSEYKGDVNIDQRIADAKKMFRKTKVDKR
jgi:transcriptional regulator with XRE-family HTH domain